MSVSNVSQPQTGFTSKTKSGSDYDKTTAGKVVAGFFIARGVLRSVIRYSLSKDKFVSTIKTSINKSKNSSVNLEKFNQLVAKHARKANGSTLFASLVGASVLFGIGALVDKLVNSHRKSVAEREDD